LSQLETGTRALSPRTARGLRDALGVEVPLPLIDPGQTAAGRRQAREIDRLRVENLYEDMREVEVHERLERLSQQLTRRFTFGTFRRRS